MEQTKTFAEDTAAAKEPEKSRLIFSDQWVPGWRRFEAKIREHPGRYFLIALAIGYLLQALPFRALLGLIGTLCLRLAKPALFLAGAVKLAEYLNKNSNRRRGLI